MYIFYVYLSSIGSVSQESPDKTLLFWRNPTAEKSGHHKFNCLVEPNAVTHVPFLPVSREDSSGYLGKSSPLGQEGTLIFLPLVSKREGS